MIVKKSPLLFIEDGFKKEDVEVISTYIPATPTMSKSSSSTDIPFKLCIQVFSYTLDYIHSDIREAWQRMVDTLSFSFPEADPNPENYNADLFSSLLPKNNSVLMRGVSLKPRAPAPVAVSTAASISGSSSGKSTVHSELSGSGSNTYGNGRGDRPGRTLVASTMQEQHLS